MSKAFTRESDDLADEPIPPRPSSALPPGAKNYMTPGGERQLRTEIEHLIQNERPRLAASPEDADAKRRLQVLDQRIRQLQHSLQTAVVVPPPASPEDRVRFGATVTVREPNGEESQYRLVGVDETDIDRGWVSYLSPIAKALINAQVGQRVRFRFPSGEKVLEIVSVGYEA